VFEIASVTLPRCDDGRLSEFAGVILAAKVLTVSETQD
jgi:hypothetical protein